MKQHKWHKEIKAWADGDEIECIHGLLDWYLVDYPNWDGDNVEFRIKPQPKEPPYLYVYDSPNAGMYLSRQKPFKSLQKGYIGKIKLEVDDENL